GYQLEQVPPGCAFPALLRLGEAMFKVGDARKKKKSPRRLLAALQAATIDERVARGSRGLLGINVPKALVLLLAHEVLLHCAVRHRLIPATDAAKTEAELARLRSLITAPPKGEEA
ncbi:MAG TPA: hypothetical protein VNZ22_10750, partial [Bacillota bacterium]|nr:hypothetical protein [Bacillota bacterium]